MQTNCVYTHAVYDKIVFKKIRAILGGNVRIMVTASAPIAKEVLDFMKCALSVPIVEGYGLTETSGGATFTRTTDPQAEVVGGPLACVKTRL